MQKRTWIMVLSLVLGLGLSNGFAADEKTAEKAAPKAEAAAPAAMPAGMDDAKMQEIMKLTTPNENHKLLEPLVGTWNTSSKWWMSATAPAEESKGTSTGAWIMDGRFVKQEFSGTSMGQPFTGMGIIGYDNIKGEYSSIWLDNMATGIMTSSAKYNAAAKTFEEHAKMSCPMTGEKEREFRMVTTIIDNDHHTYDMYMTGEDGKEFKGMEIVYERAK